MSQVSKAKVYGALDGDYGGRREWYLEHRHGGLDLDMQYAGGC